jgi:hypothetical protein
MSGLPAERPTAPALEGAYQFSLPWQVTVHVVPFHELIDVPVPPTFFVPFTWSETLTVLAV